MGVNPSLPNGQVCIGLGRITKPEDLGGTGSCEVKETPNPKASTVAVASKPKTTWYPPIIVEANRPVITPKVVAGGKEQAGRTTVSLEHVSCVAGLKGGQAACEMEAIDSAVAAATGKNLTFSEQEAMVITRSKE